MSESLTGPGLLAGIKANSIVSAKLKYVVLSDLKPKIPKFLLGAKTSLQALVPEFSWWRHYVAPLPTS